MTELQAFLLMLDRCGVEYDRSEGERSGEAVIELCPKSEWSLHAEGKEPSKVLTGDSWASTEFVFTHDGSLLKVHMEDD